MSGSNVPLDTPDLAALEAYLESERAPEGCMRLSGLDGYLAAIAIGPELVMPSEWLPVIWGDDQPVFDSGDEMQAVLDGIMSRYNQILRTVEDGSFAPILLYDTDEMPLPFDWAEGFMTGIGLRVKAWEPLLHSKTEIALMLPILGLCSDEDGEPVLPLDQEERERLIDEAPERLPQCVRSIAAYWRARRGDAPTVPPRARRKIGRNDPCPCGSGKKFKLCCGR